MRPTPTSPDRVRSVAVCVLAYEAASTITEVLARIPTLPAEVTVLVADDASHDDTAAVARRWARDHERADVVVETWPRNLGYGGNQVACVRWAAEHGIDAVAMLHGDAQYPPEALDRLLVPMLEGDADAVFGSRMIEPGAARAGGMPWFRRVGNRVLSAAQNRLVGARLSEWHSGLRAYRMTALDRIDVGSLPAGFDVDTVATLRLLSVGAVVEEIAIPTRYAGETSRIRPVRDGWRILTATIRHRRRPFEPAPAPGPRLAVPMEVAS